MQPQLHILFICWHRCPCLSLPGRSWPFGEGTASCSEAYKRPTCASEAFTKILLGLYDLLLLLSPSVALQMRPPNTDYSAVPPMLLSCRGHDLEACPAASALLHTLRAPKLQRGLFAFCFLPSWDLP